MWHTALINHKFTHFTHQNKCETSSAYLKAKGNESEHQFTPFSHCLIIMFMRFCLHQAKQHHNASFYFLYFVNFIHQKMFQDFRFSIEKYKKAIFAPKWKMGLRWLCEWRYEIENGTFVAVVGVMLNSIYDELCKNKWHFKVSIFFFDVLLHFFHIFNLEPVGRLKSIFSFIIMNATRMPRLNILLEGKVLIIMHMLREQHTLNCYLFLTSHIEWQNFFLTQRIRVRKKS